MARGKAGSSKERIEKSRGVLPSKSEANKVAVLANSPKEVRDAVEQKCKEKDKADKLTKKVGDKFNKFVAITAQAAKTETGIEVVGGMSAQALNELGNLGFRSLGEWSEKSEGMDGFWARNVDLSQSIPGALGSIIYILEKALRPEFNKEDTALPTDERRPFIPAPWRRGVSEASKVAAHLGLSNTLRALRFRWSEGIDERREKLEAIAERDKLLRQANDELDKLKAQVRQLLAAKAGPEK